MSGPASLEFKSIDIGVAGRAEMPHWLFLPQFSSRIRAMPIFIVNHQGDPPPLGEGRNWVRFPKHSYMMIFLCKTQCTAKIGFLAVSYG